MKSRRTFRNNLKKRFERETSSCCSNAGKGVTRRGRHSVIFRLISVFVLTICTVILNAVMCQNAEAQLSFTSTANASTYCNLYNPGMGPGEVGLATNSPGTYNTVTMVNLNYGGTGWADADSPTEYLPDVQVWSEQSIVWTWNLPQNWNSNQQYGFTASLDVAATNGSAVFCSILTQGIPDYTGWQKYNGQDVGGTWGQSIPVSIAQHPSGSVTISVKAQSQPLPGTGEHANIKFGLNMLQLVP